MGQTIVRVISRGQSCLSYATANPRRVAAGGPSYGLGARAVVSYERVATFLSANPESQKLLLPDGQDWRVER